MKTLNIYDELKSNSYPGRGIVIGKSADGKSAVTAYFIMGRSVNSRNRVFTETEDGIKTEAADPSKLSDPTPYYILPCSCAWKQDYRYKRRSDGHYLRAYGQAADF